MQAPLFIYVQTEIKHTLNKSENLREESKDFRKLPERIAAGDIDL